MEAEPAEQPGSSEHKPSVELDWDEVEAKYWASMNDHYQKALRQIEVDFKAAKKPLEKRILESTNAFMELEEEETALIQQLQQVRQKKVETATARERIRLQLQAIYLEHEQARAAHEESKARCEAEQRENFRMWREQPNLGKVSGPASSEEQKYAPDVAWGGPVQPPLVESLSDNGPHENKPVTAPQPKENGQDAQAGHRDVEMSDPDGIHQDPESIATREPCATPAVQEATPNHQSSSATEALIPPTVPADPTAPAVPEPSDDRERRESSPLANGRQDQNETADQDGEKPTAERAVDAAVDEDMINKTTVPDDYGTEQAGPSAKGIPPSAAETRETTSNLPLEANKAPEKGTVISESPVAAEPDTREPVEAPAVSAEDESTALEPQEADAVMIDAVIREKETGPSEAPVTETERADASNQSLDATVSDVTMADESSKAPPALDDLIPEEPTETSKAGEKVRNDTADSPQAPSPASSLSSLSSSFEDLDEQPESPTNPRGVVQVVDENQQLVGHLRPLGRENRSISLITKLPIMRAVQIRSGRRFTAEDLDKVHHPSDQKGAKWISMMIQATGDIQEQPCHTCAKNNGVYQDCIIVADENFGKCGNCEWNRHACHGAGRPASRQSAAEKNDAKRPITPSGFTFANQSFTSLPLREGDSISVDGVPSPTTGIKNSVMPKKFGRTSLPSGRKPSTVGLSNPDTPGTPMVGSPEVSAYHVDHDLPEITPDILCLRDNGVVFTEPELMRGVPLEKISPDHPYWDPSWDADIASKISKELAKWQEKFDDLERQKVNDHRKYEAKRQVNRGNTILDWLERGELHPYQLVAKEWMNTKKLIKYNTLYRLAQMLANELPLYRLEMKASDWMRHRLNELFLKEGDQFNLAFQVSGFYHDPKVQQVRDKAGFTSVGRPHKASTKKAAGEFATPKGSVQKLLKRKELPTEEATPKQEAPAPPSQQTQTRSSPRKIVVVVGASTSAGGTTAANAQAAATTTTNTTAVPPSPLAPDDSDDEDDQIMVQQSPVPSRHPAKKKIRLTVSTGSPTPVLPTAPDLNCDGYTSIDSCSEDQLHDIDWRINQIKTPEVSTNPSVTQYWHFVGGTAGMLEHQVLKQLRPAKWAVFKHPYDFHLRYKEVSEIVYAAQSDRVIIRFKKAKNQAEGEGRGDMLAEFKRARTKKRFLKFMAAKGVKLLRSSRYIFF